MQLKLLRDIVKRPDMRLFLLRDIDKRPVRLVTLKEYTTSGLFIMGVSVRIKLLH